MEQQSRHTLIAIGKFGSCGKKEALSVQFHHYQAGTNVEIKQELVKDTDDYPWRAVIIFQPFRRGGIRLGTLRIVGKERRARSVGYL